MAFSSEEWHCTRGLWCVLTATHREEPCDECNCNWRDRWKAYKDALLAFRRDKEAKE